MKNGPWQFDFHALLLEEYDGSARPSGMVFDRLDVWVRVFDLPLDKMNRAHGERIGNWIGKFISVEVEEDGTAWGEELRIRVEVKVDQPLVRGINLRDSEDDKEGKWFDIKYEKIPHFCFECGRLVHSTGECEVDKEGMPQWGEWLRASPGRHKKMSTSQRPSFSSDSYSSRSGERAFFSRDRGSVRDLPPRRTLFRDRADSGSSRTGGGDQFGSEREVSSPNKLYRGQLPEKGKDVAQAQAKKPMTYVRRPRVVPSDNQAPKGGGQPPSPPQKKRRSRQMWVPRAELTNEGGEELTLKGKKQKVNSVFDRISVPNDESASPAQRDRRTQ
jgi:hypothetical protein